MTSHPDNDPTSSIKRIAIFASGAGTNTQKIIKHFYLHPFIKVELVVCNNPKAGVLEIAKVNQINTLVIEKELFFKGDGYSTQLKNQFIDFIVLAGFLWKVPAIIIEAYRNKIINIHPALLPKYGGKGMYGAKVHEAVIAAGEKDSGITIHYVDEHYDNGNIIFQTYCPILENDNAESLAEKIHALEYTHYPAVIERLLSK